VLSHLACNGKVGVHFVEAWRRDHIDSVLQALWKRMHVASSKKSTLFVIDAAGLHFIVGGVGLRAGFDGQFLFILLLLLLLLPLILLLLSPPPLLMHSPLRPLSLAPRHLQTFRQVERDKGGREGGREGERERGREGERERGREGGRERLTRGKTK
jgi:hypothetical protein